MSFSYTNEASGSRSFRAELLWSGIHRRAEAQDVRHPKPAISRLFLFESGFAEAECAAGKFRLAPGRIHLLPQGQDFRIRYSAGSVLYHWHLSVVNALGFPLFSKVRGIPCLKDRPRFVKDLIDARQADDAGLWHGLLFQVVLYFSKLEASHSTLDPLSASPLSPVLEYVHSHPHVSCTVEFLSGKFSIPRRELSLGFRKVMGVPLKKYLLQVQLRRAKELLSNQELSVEAIALTLGFEHPTYFYRFFKRGAAVTPNTYRRAQKS
ncbi:MAG: helix-turn-helix transcriptional regulator [Spirochaetia bacterium]|nr:helix-turn-helix transcriptional regulator [Spirochaetia bacterium]